MADRTHPVAAAGFDRGAAAYQRARPGYADELVDRMTDAPPPVIDLAAGTGKLTDALVARGLEPVVVEPVAGMLEELRGRTALAAVRGRAERLPLRDGSIGTVCVAQAFHWFDAGSALAEILRVLTPGGWLALLFNERDESVDWVAEFTRMCVHHGGGRPYTPHGDRSWPHLLVDAGFVDVVEHHAPNPIHADVEGLMDRAASTSYVAALDPDRLFDALEDVRRLAETHPQLRGRRTFVFPHTTQLVIGRRPS